MLRTLVPTMPRMPRRFGDFDRDMNRLMERFFAPVEGFWTGELPAVPAANVAETDGTYEVTLELPGMKPEDVTVEVRGNELWVAGEKKEEKEEKGKTMHRVERTFGRFERVLPLPAEVREGEVEATFHDGVLKIVLPKTPEAKRRPIEVKKG